jgi:hypothetical protein
MPAQNGNGVSPARPTCGRCFLFVRLYAALAIAVVDLVKQEVKRKIAKELIKRWLN